ncbi:MAG: glucose-1-phosphate thymidylyltransferase [Actinomycetota bacterium]|nr:glucose-1-phosphate thymidylyltransferase [Actinomycetota bacterium]
MKGLILAGGSGRRLRPFTHTSAKQLVPIANRPILHYVIDDLVGVGVTDIGIVVGDTAAEILASVGDGSAWGATVTYIEQDEPLGLAHAVLVAENFLGDAPFVMYLGDNMFSDSLESVVAGFDVRNTEARLLLAEVENPSAFGVAEINATGEIVALVEKPEQPRSNLALVGVYLFGPRIHEAVRSITPSARGELEITDAIQWLIDRDGVVEHHVLDGWWIDTGKKDPLLRCNELVLETISASVEGTVDEGSNVDGLVRVEQGAEVVGSVLVGPVIVGAGALISASTVGPYVSVGVGCRLERSTVERSVLMEKARVVDVGRLTDSVIGREAEVRGVGMASMLLGDHSVVELGTPGSTSG